MDPQVLSALLGFFGALVGGVVTVWAMFRIERANRLGIESDEIRRRKIEIIFQLLGSRYVLSDNYPASEIDVKDFNTAMALFSAFFANDGEVMSAYDRVLNTKNDDNLISMLKIAAKKAHFELLDTHIKRVMTVPPRLVSLKLDPKSIPQQADSKGGSS